jgi:hypothetical protein
MYCLMACASLQMLHSFHFHSALRTSMLHSNFIHSASASAPSRSISGQAVHTFHYTPLCELSLRFTSFIRSFRFIPLLHRPQFPPSFPAVFISLLRRVYPVRKGNFISKYFVLINDAILKRLPLTVH